MEWPGLRRTSEITSFNHTCPQLPLLPSCKLLLHIDVGIPLQATAPPAVKKKWYCCNLCLPVIALLLLLRARNRHAKGPVPSLKHELSSSGELGPCLHLKAGDKIAGQVSVAVLVRNHPAALQKGYVRGEASVNLVSSSKHPTSPLHTTQCTWSRTIPGLCFFSCWMRMLLCSCLGCWEG